MRGAPKGKISKRNFKYWIDLGYSEEDAKFESRKRMPGTFEYFRFFKNQDESTAIQSYNEWKRCHKVTLEIMCEKYGKDLGTQKFESYRQKQALTNSYEYKKKKYGWTQAEFREFNLSRAVTEKNFIQKYGEEKGKQKYNAYVERQKYAGCSEEYFIEKYGIEEGKKKYQLVNFLKGHSYETYLIRFDGDVEQATEAHYKFLQSVAHRTSFSNISQQLFNDIIKNETFKDHKIFFQSLNQEWFISVKGDTSVKFVDFFDKTTGRIIEFYGDYWHANPRIYAEDDIVKYPENPRLVKEIWERDRTRIDFLRKIPYINDILIVWEYDYVNDTTKTIEECIKFLLK